MSVKLHVLEEESQYHCDILTWSGHAALDVLLESRTDDSWKVDGGREQSGPWTVCMVRRAADKKIKQQHGLVIDGQKFCQECQRAFEKPKLDNAGKLSGVYLSIRQIF